mgnify:FL=1|jgi:methanogenic corrinoid protein MtbC1
MIKERGSNAFKKGPDTSLPSTIESEIIPRLLIAQRQKIGELSKKGASTKKSGQFVSPNNIEELLNLILDSDIENSKLYLRALLNNGLKIEKLYTELLQPVARQLGVYWEEDSLDFSTITVALWQIHQLMYFLSPELMGNRKAILKNKILLFSALGSQHTLGLFMLSEFFRKNGWQVHADPSPSEEDIFLMIKEKQFDIVGISIGSVDQKNSTKRIIRKIREKKESFSKILIGGPLALQDKLLFEKLGADGQALDAEEAIKMAEGFILEKEKNTLSPV